VIVISTLQAMTSIKEISLVIGEVTARHQIPVLVCYMGVTDISDALKILDERHIPHYKFPEAAARAMASMAEYSHWLTRKRTEVKVFADVDKARVEEILAEARSQKRAFLPEPLSHSILKAYGFPMIESRVAKNEEEW